MEAAAVDKRPAAQEFAGTDFRNTVGSFATGVTVITTRGADDADEDVYGMTANAFSSVSLDPPLILVCVNSGTQGAETIARNGVFAVNVLGAHQEPISRHFSSRERPSGRAAFAGLAALQRGDGVADPRAGGRVPRLPRAGLPRGGGSPHLHRRGRGPRLRSGRSPARLPRRRVRGPARGRRLGPTGGANA